MKGKIAYLTAKEACLNYHILPYPKEENENYILGEFQKPILVKAN